MAGRMIIDWKRSHIDRTAARSRLRILGAATAALALISISVVTSPVVHAAPAPVGQGFTVTPSDLAFILKQIKIAERHSATLTASNPCGTLVGSAPNQIPDAL